MGRPGRVFANVPLVRQTRGLPTEVRFSTNAAVALFSRDEPEAVGVCCTSRDCEALHATCTRSVLWCSGMMAIGARHASMKPTFPSASLLNLIEPKGAEDRRKDQDP